VGPRREAHVRPARVAAEAAGHDEEGASNPGRAPQREGGRGREHVPAQQVVGEQLRTSPENMSKTC